jgi:flagellar L-ring protein precursor FlgH
MKIKIRIAIVTLFLALVCSVGAAPVADLYSDHRAMKVDDILTVVVIENAKAGSTSKTNTSKENGVNVSGSGGSGLFGWLPSFGASGESKIDYDGQGGTERQGSLAAKVSARVIEVFDNGNLVIEGSKVVEINDEKEIIKISGTVRPQDIAPDNSVYSYNIADAQITYTGKGAPSTARRPGIFARFFNWIF